MLLNMFAITSSSHRRTPTRVKDGSSAPAQSEESEWQRERASVLHQDCPLSSAGAPRSHAPAVANLSAEASDAVTKLCVTYARTVDSRDLEAWIMGEVIVKYKVNLDEDGQGRIDGIVDDLTGLPTEVGAVQHVEKKPLAFGMMFVEVQVVIEDGEGHLDRFEEAVIALGGVSNLETLELGRL